MRVLSFTHTCPYTQQAGTSWDLRDVRVGQFKLLTSLERKPPGASAAAVSKY